jgi:hypothetical protein
MNSQTRNFEDRSEFEKFTMEELITRINKSEADYENGRFKSQEELEALSANW